MQWYTAPVPNSGSMSLFSKTLTFLPPVNGIFNEKAGILKGLRTMEARKKIIEELEKAGHIVKQEPIKHVVNVHERCKTPIEIIGAKQWFVKYLDLRDE